MSTLFVESEYDMDLVLREAIKLVKLKDSQLHVGFHNMDMVDIFLSNFHTELAHAKIDPGKKNFMLNIMVKQDEQA
jgi:hypothetical protein